MVGDLPEDKVQISVVVDRKVADRIKELADMVGISRSNMTRNLIYNALEDAQILSALGLLQAATKAQKMFDYIKTQLKMRS